MVLLSRSALEVEQGIMIQEIKITSDAIHFSDGDYFSKNDLFAKVTLGECIKRTSTKWDMDMCTWDEPLYFPTPPSGDESGRADTIHIEILDEDAWGPDQKINSIEMKLDESPAGWVCIDGIQIKWCRVCLLDPELFSEAKAKEEQLSNKVQQLQMELTRMDNTIREIRKLVSLPKGP